MDTRLGTKALTRPATEAERPTCGAEPSGPAPHTERSRPSPRTQALGAGVGKVSLYNAWFSVGLNFVNSENYQGLIQNFKTRWAEFWDS